MIETLTAWNEAAPQQALDEILPANGAQAWAHRMVASRPFASEAALLAAADVIWVELDDAAQAEAYAAHPGLGAAPLTGGAAQQDTPDEEAELRTALAAANQLYEERFGLTYIACVNGKYSAELLQQLRQRLGNEPAEEAAEAAEQQRRTMQLHLRRWLGMPAAHCDDV